MASNATDPAAAAAMAAALAEAQNIVYVEQIYFCAMYAVVVWDWITSLTREWELIWKKSWTPVKVVYIFCRYWPICAVPYVLWVYTTNHDLDTCQRIFKSPVLLMMWNQLSAEVVLLIRTYAFLGRKLWLLLFLCATLLGVAAYQMFVPLAEMNLLPFFTPPTGPCFPVAKPGSLHVTGFFIAPLIFDAGVTIITLWRAIAMRWSTSASARSPILKTFVQEGLWYFVLISAANLLNAIFYLQPKAVIQALNIPLSIMFPNILACRLILGLRERGGGGDASTRGGNSGRSQPFSPRATFGGTGAKRSPGHSGIDSVGDVGLATFTENHTPMKGTPTKGDLENGMHGMPITVPLEVGGVHTSVVGDYTDGAGGIIHRLGSPPNSPRTTKSQKRYTAGAPVEGIRVEVERSYHDG